MALVVFIKGVNIGGHRTFRPTTLARRLKRYGAINIGAAGTFIIQSSVSRELLRKTIRRLMPFEVTIMICEGRDILRLVSQNPFREQRLSRRDIVQFVSIQAKIRQPLNAPPFTVPETGRWSIKVLSHYKCFVIGMHRREMSVLKHLGQLERLLGGSITTRSWSTILSIARLLGAEHAAVDQNGFERESVVG